MTFQTLNHRTNRIRSRRVCVQCSSRKSRRTAWIRCAIRSRLVSVHRRLSLVPVMQFRLGGFPVCIHFRAAVFPALAKTYYANSMHRDDSVYGVFSKRTVPFPVKFQSSVRYVYENLYLPVLYILCMA